MDQGRAGQDNPIVLRAAAPENIGYFQARDRYRCEGICARIGHAGRGESCATFVFAAQEDALNSPSTYLTERGGFTESFSGIRGNDIKPRKGGGKCMTSFVDADAGKEGGRGLGGVVLVVCSQRRSGGSESLGDIQLLKP